MLGTLHDLEWTLLATVGPLVIGTLADHLGRRQKLEAGAHGTMGIWLVESRRAGTETMDVASLCIRAWMNIPVTAANTSSMHDVCSALARASVGKWRRIMVSSIESMLIRRIGWWGS